MSNAITSKKQDIDLMITIESNIGFDNDNSFGPDRPFSLDCNQHTSQTANCMASNGNCMATNCYSQSIDRTKSTMKVLRIA